MPILATRAHSSNSARQKKKSFAGVLCSGARFSAAGAGNRIAKPLMKNEGLIVYVRFTVRDLSSWRQGSLKAGSTKTEGVFETKTEDVGPGRVAWASVRCCVIKHSSETLLLGDDE